MDIHKNARSCAGSRGLMVRRVLDEGWSVKSAAAAAGFSERTAYKWLARYRQEGEAGLVDRSSRPIRSPRQLSSREKKSILQLRRQRMSGSEIAARLGKARSTVARVLHRHGLNRLSALEPTTPPRRYERSTPGELLHLDIKKLARIERIGHRATGNRRDTTAGAGWEFVHVCIDDRSRIAYSEVLPDERKHTACAFLRRAVSWFERREVTIQQVMTDNGSCYVSSTFAETCRELGLRHLRTRPYTPRTNGKAERLIQTLLREWAYRFVYDASSTRRRWLHHYLHFYNHHRQHASLNRRAPISRLQNMNNVVGFHT